MIFDGQDLAAARQRGARGGRALSRDIQMIFQDPFSSLNPRHTVGSIVGAPFRYQRLTPPGGIKHTAQSLLEQVGLSAEHYNRYPQEFSGGQRQRICIARAIALRPKLIIADEPVSALDVSIQAQIINLLDDLQDAHGLTYLFIAHDLSVVRHIADRVAVMYLGRIVEVGTVEEVLLRPQHPYTRALLDAVPSTSDLEAKAVLRGEPPDPTAIPAGCRFHPRCPLRATLPEDQAQLCLTDIPVLAPALDERQVACVHAEAAPPAVATHDPAGVAR
jgi:peptide/nickel transport system ATP-binding protein